MDIETVCNTHDDILFGNIEANSRLPIPWVRSVEAHEGHAVLVGGGPSVSDWLEEIRWRKSIGQTIFALNAAAKMLSEHGIEVDHQVVVDARDHNLEFLGFAKHHLLASHVHPSLFAKAKSVTLWHQEYPNDMARFDACLPDNRPAHALIGGGTTVGLSAMVLAYALGYRKLHLYGFDSSYRDDKTHAYKQADPQRVDCIATVCGRKFLTSLAMAKQAELFPQLADSLIDLGCVITIRGEGLLPWTSKMSQAMAERDKYRLMWDIAKYRTYSPGEEVAETFVNVSGVEAKHSVIDFGCGTGRGGKRIHEMTGANVHLVDFADNCLDREIALPLTIADLSQPIPLKADYGFCADVMEHIPPEQVEAVVKNILACVSRCFFQISLVPDAMGALIGQPLHLSVHSYEWWAELFRSLGYSIAWSENHGESAVYFIHSTT